MLPHKGEKGGGELSGAVHMLSLATTRGGVVTPTHQAPPYISSKHIQPTGWECLTSTVGNQGSPPTTEAADRLQRPRVIAPGPARQAVLKSETDVKRTPGSFLGRSHLPNPVSSKPALTDTFFSQTLGPTLEDPPNRRIMLI